MVESDHNEDECKTVKQSEDSKITDESSSKRSREESDTEDEVLKKRARLDVTVKDEEKLTSIAVESNGHSKGSKDNTNDNIIPEDDNVQNNVKDNLHDKIISDSKENKNDFLNNDIKEEKKESQLDENLQVDNTESTTNDDESKFDVSTKMDIDIKENNDESVKDNDSKDKLKQEIFNNKKKNNSEIINGVELTVECASDEESNEEEEEEEIRKPRSKTIIVREKANASEVEVSSSEAEKSDSYEILEAKSKTSPTSSLDSSIKKSKKKDKQKSFTKTVASDSENSSVSNSDDEDYSPISKKKTNKSPTPKKSTTKPTEVKRGRGRPRGRPPKIRKIEKALDEVEKEETKIIEIKKDKSNTTADDATKELKDIELKIEPKNQDSVSEVSDNLKSDNSNNSEDVKNGKRRKSSTRNINRIDNLKKFVRACGLRIKCYKTFWKDCKTDAARARRLSEFLAESGIVGRPTFEKCKALRRKNETISDARELDTSCIISETRVTRGRNTRKSQVENEVPTSKFKNIKNVVDSDSE